MVPLQSASYLQLSLFSDNQIHRPTDIKVLNSKQGNFECGG